MEGWENTTANENQYVEVMYLDVDEEAILSELHDIDNSQLETTLTPSETAGHETVELIETQESFIVEIEDNIAHGTVAQDFVAGKISFEDFINKVEHSDESSPSSDVSSDESSDDDDDYEAEDDKDDTESDTEDDSDDELLHRQRKSHAATSKATEPSKGKPPQKGRKKGTRAGKRLPPDLAALLGEATLRYVREEKQDAMNLCMEVIRRAPNYAEPYQTLSMFYEALGDSEKSYQLSLIAAYLSPNDADEWSRLAELCLTKNDNAQAAKCLGKAAKADPTNIQIHQSRCQLLEAMGAHKDLLHACITMLKCVEPGSEEKMNEWVELAVRIARIHHASGHMHCARKALTSALVHCHKLFTMEHYNLLFELQLITKRYFDMIKVMHKYCGIEFDIEFQDQHDFNSTKTMQLTQELPMDIQSKLYISLVYLGKLDMTSELHSTLVKSDVESFGDLYLDVSDALSENRHYELACNLLSCLVGSSTFSLAEVWLKYAHCLSAMNSIEEGIAAYRHVIALVPTSQDARISLAELLTNQGRNDEALAAVTQDSGDAYIEATILHHRCLLLLKEDKWDQFVSAYKLLMMRHAKQLRSKDEIYKACGAKKIGWESDEESSDDELEFGSSSVDIQEEYRLLRLASEYLFKENRLVELERMCFMALTSPLFRRKREIHREIQFITLQVCIAKGDSYYAYNLVRSVLLRFDHLYNNKVWNLLIQVIMRGDDVRYNRFLVRLLVKHPEHVILSVLNGHACVASGTYKYALDEYMSACKADPKNPFYLLLSSVVLVQLTCQKFSSGKHSLVTQTSAFFDAYRKVRDAPQEVYYNIGRGMHQLGLLPQALQFYEKALSSKPSITKGNNAHVFDLSREIAFNMSLIYRTSADASSLDSSPVRLLIDKYITI